MEDIKTYINELQSANISDADFKNIINRGINILMIDSKDIAREFGVSRPTISRWESGTTAPHPALRPHIYSWLMKLAKARLNK